MREDDGRTLSQEAQFERRKRAVRVHHSKIVKAWLLKNADKIEAHYLPSYSPELNPEERLNADLKHRLRSRVQVRTKEKLRAATEAHMQEIKAQPERVMAYFRDPHVKYASSFNG